MSEEEDDDRMDRARRIRRMREGDDDRSDDETVADDADEPTDETATDHPADDDSGEGDADEETAEVSVEAADEPVGADGDAEETADEETVADETSDEEVADEAESPAVADGSEVDSDEQGAVDDESEMEWGSPGGEADDESAPDSGGIEPAEAGTAGPGVESAETGPDEDQGGDVPDEDDGGISAPLPGADQLEEALEQSGADAAAETVTPDEVGGEESEAESEEETRVLEFTLHDEHYCLDIDYIEEIVKEETVTRVPNTPAFVEGVVDLRGQITTILNPKVTIGKPDQTPGDLIVVFDSDAFEDQGHIGWVVDDVRQVSLITEGDVNDPPMEQDHVVGVIDRDGDDEFVIWTTPDLVFDEADESAAGAEQ